MEAWASSTHEHTVSTSSFGLHTLIYDGAVYQHAFRFIHHRETYLTRTVMLQLSSTLRERDRAMR